MQRTFIIGDIHGCSKTFRKLVTEEIQLRKSDKLYCIGDYIDRGNDSKGVIDFILKLRKENYQVHTLRGNHEQMLLQSTESEQKFESWMNNGGEATLNSFRINTVKELEPAYLNFFKRTKYFIQTKKFILVHAGLNFAIPKPLKDKDAMLWIRDYPIDYDFLNGRILIHGHTPRPYTFILSQKFESPINLDGGCVYKHRESLGHLYALNFTDKKFIEVKNID